MVHFTLVCLVIGHCCKPVCKLEEVISPVSLTTFFQDQDGDTPLHFAIACENHNMADMLLNNPRLIRTITNHKGFNYLQFAALKGNKP